MDCLRKDKTPILVLVVGKSNAGKTSLLERLIKDKKAQIESVQPTPNEPATVIWKKVEFIDCAGNDLSKQLWHAYYNSVNAVIYVIDGTLKSQETLDEFERIILPLLRDDELQEKPIALAVNKCDMIGSSNSKGSSGNVGKKKKKINIAGESTADRSDESTAKGPKLGKKEKKGNKKNKEAEINEGSGEEDAKYSPQDSEQEKMEKELEESSDANNAHGDQDGSQSEDALKSELGCFQTLEIALEKEKLDWSEEKGVKRFGSVKIFKCSAYDRSTMLDIKLWFESLGRYYRAN